METASDHRAITREMFGKKRVHNRARKAFRPTKHNQYAFLNEPIKEIAYSDIASDLEFGDIDWERNLSYIEASARRWCELHNHPYAVEKGNSPLTSIGKIHAYLSTLTDEYRFDVDYIPKEKAFKIIEYRYCDFPGDTLFFFPAKCLNYYEGTMREIMLRFISFMYYNTLFLLPCDSYDFSMFMDLAYYEDDDADPDFVEMVKSYKSGEADKIFNEIANVPKKARTASAIKELIAEVEKDVIDKRLLTCIKKGLDLIVEDDLRNHSYFDGFSSDERFDIRFEDGDKITPDRMFVICYGFSNDDCITENAIRSFSEEANNLEIQYFRDGHHLSPDDKEKFEPSTYPLEWSKWFSDLMDLVSYEQVDE